MKLNIIHTNDIHSKIENLSKVYPIVEEIRQSDQELLLLDAGDMITGCFQFKYNGGKAEQEISNYLQYDYTTLGNHDFECGLPFLKNYMNSKNTKHVVSNLKDNTNQIGSFKPYYIKEINECKIGILGFYGAYPDWLDEEFPCITYIGEESNQHIIDELRELGADYIIAINHQGVDADINLAKTTNGIDLIIGGHSHTLIKEPLAINDTTIVQAGSFGKYIGQLQLEVSEGNMSINSYELIDLEQDLKRDDKLQNIIDKYFKISDEHAKEVYGRCSHKLEGDRSIISKRSTNLGSLICDSFEYYARNIGYNPDFVIITSVVLRQSIEAGNITRKELYNVMPFEDGMIILEVSGAILKKALDNKIDIQTKNIKVIN